jgi:hypothetical protein
MEAKPVDIGKSELHVTGSNVGSEDQAAQALWIDPGKEKKLVRKLDLWISPVMLIVFLTGKFSSTLRRVTFTFMPSFLCCCARITSPFTNIRPFTAYLDRSNIGNAASAGMTDDLNLTSEQLGSTYALPTHQRYCEVGYEENKLIFGLDAITLFYVTYVAFEVPCSLVLKKFRPSRFLPTPSPIAVVCLLC